MDENIERELHQGFVGRDAVIAALDRWLVTDGVDRKVFLAGGQGTGKTAIVVHWLSRREAARDFVPHHFVRRLATDRVDPLAITRALAVQIEARHPRLCDRFVRPEARLVELLQRVSARELVPRNTRMILVIDGLDERQPRSDLLGVLLPGELPPGVRLLCAGRDLCRDGDRTGAGHGSVVRIDLDDPSLAGDNDATVAAFWAREAPALGLDDRFVDHAVRCAGGNMLYASALRGHMASLPAPRTVGGMSRGLPALLEVLWGRVYDDPIAVHGLGILCAAREPLSLDQLAGIADWSCTGDHRAFVHVTRELVVELRRGERAVYWLAHDAIRRAIADKLGPCTMRERHRELAERLATWPLPRDAAGRRYALRHAVDHRIAAGDCRAAHALAGNLDFLETRCDDIGIDDAERDVRRAARACLDAGELTLAGGLDELARKIARESGGLRGDTGARLAQLWNGLRTPAQGAVASPPAVDAPVSAAPAGRTVAVPGRPPLLRKLIAERSRVTSCAVTVDGRRVVAGFSDHSLKVWEPGSGRVLNKLTGHTGPVARCAVTLDGRRAVSASADATLKVWDLDTGRVLVTLEGHTDAVASCAIVPGGRRVVSASADSTLRVWDLETGAMVTTLGEHTAAVTDCAVTPDGRRVVSASADTTLKVWDLDTGQVVTTLAGHECEVACCAVTANGRCAVSGAGDQTLKIWDLETGTALQTLDASPGWIARCTGAPAGKSWWAASSDTSLRIWDLATGQLVAMFEGHAGPITCCAVTSDGRLVISGASDTLRVWELDNRRMSTIVDGGAPTITAARTGTITPRRAKKPPSRHGILFLAGKANDPVRQDECAAIERELQLAPHGGDFEFRSKWMVTVDTMARHLLEMEPAIIHVSGHGGRGAGPRDSGVFFVDEQHQPWLVPSKALAKMIETTVPSARVVVLNGCYSDGCAAALCDVVECVVGMGRVTVEHAIPSFSVALYRALGNRRSVGTAYAHAVATLVAKLPDESIPRCRTRDWIDPQQIVL